jgi:hypothetical protein
MKRQLPVRLTDEERSAKSLELAKLVKKVNEIKQEARDQAAAYRAKLKPMAKRLSELAEIVELGEEARPVEVKQVESNVNGAAEYERADTGERWTEPAVEKPNQPTLPDAKKKAGKPKEPKAAKSTKPNGPNTEFATGEPAIGIGDDGEEHDLTAEDADKFRCAQNVFVQGEKGPVEILKLKRVPKAGAPTPLPVEAQQQMGAH